ncbi:hypothetical protein [Salinisphaera sp. PC39]|uniref:hypothetical protein n=1 Tax=Salinisphaera sp. PC39 TaxID=1304156 RepID=UPI0033423C5A
MEALSNVPLILWLLLIVCPVAAYWLFARNKITPSRRRRQRKRDPDLMNLLMGDAAKYDRLVKYHGSVDIAKAKLLRDRGSYR